MNFFKTITFLHFLYILYHLTTINKIKYNNQDIFKFGINFNCRDFVEPAHGKLVGWVLPSINSEVI